MGYDFKGIYNVWEKNVNLFSGDSWKNIEEIIEIKDIFLKELDGLIGEKVVEDFWSELELVYEVYLDFNFDEYFNGLL